MDPKASFPRTLVPKGMWDHSSSFTGGGKGGGKRASRHLSLSPSPEVRALGFRLELARK